MHKLSSAQVSPARIVGDVLPVVEKLIFATDQMIEVLYLPEAALVAEASIDLNRGEVLPRIALSQHRICRRECRQQMDVVGHDDKIGKDVPVAVKMMQAVGDDLG